MRLAIVAALGAIGVADGLAPSPAWRRSAGGLTLRGAVADELRGLDLEVRQLREEVELLERVVEKNRPPQPAAIARPPPPAGRDAAELAAEERAILDFLREDDDDDIIDEEVRILSEVFREQTGFSILNEDQSDWSGAFKFVSISCTILFVVTIVSASLEFGHGLRGAAALLSGPPPIQ